MCLRIGGTRIGVPERQGADDHEEGRQEDRSQREGSARKAVRSRLHHRAEVGGEGEERARDRALG